MKQRIKEYSNNATLRIKNDVASRLQPQLHFLTSLRQRDNTTALAAIKNNVVVFDKLLSAKYFDDIEAVSNNNIQTTRIFDGNTKTVTYDNTAVFDIVHRSIVVLEESKTVIEKQQQIIDTFFDSAECIEQAYFGQISEIQQTLEISMKTVRHLKWYNFLKNRRAKIEVETNLSKIKNFNNMMYRIMHENKHLRLEKCFAAVTNKKNHF